MSLIWILLIVVIALALFGGLGFAGRRGDGVADGTGTRGGFGLPGGVLGLVAVVILVILLVSLLT